MDQTDKQPQEEELRFFATPPRPCSYLDDHTAISVFADPDATLSPHLYSQLARFGFRRSGSDLYVPACPGCSECVPVRIPVNRFRRSRNLQKLWNRNRDIEWEVLDPVFDPRQFELYSNYLGARHADGGMDNPNEEDYQHFLSCDWCDTSFLVGKLENRPVIDFEACYYQGIDYCIDHGLAYFEPGAQGEHKISRGFMPTPTWSAHWISDPRFREIISRFLAQETAGMYEYMEELAARSPFRQGVAA